MGMRVVLILLLAVIIPASAHGEADEPVPTLETPVSPTGTDYSPLTPGGKTRLYLLSTVAPLSIFASAFSSGFNQAIDSVPEWGQGMEGYGKRFASSMGQKTVEKTVYHGMKIMLREDPRYFYSDRQGIMPRTLHAVSETFIAHKDSGGTRPDYSYFAGVASGVYISRQWHPERYRTAQDYITGVATSVGIQSAKNVFTEFWPDIRKKFLKR
jgi:hypothetical protein